MDTLSAEQRSARMALVRAKNTKPELRVRRLVHHLGFRYRLHRRDLPGKPDLVFSARKRIIFVHGCFWHRHKKCALARMPRSRELFWRTKLEGNALRDKRNNLALRKLGWAVITIWECQLSDVVLLTTRIRRFLNAKR
jgi:DNA mismatch endonuclease (patch repair protein)